MFSINLKKYRKLAHFTQEELAININSLLSTEFTKDNVGKWEKNTNPKLEVITAIADILGIAEQYLFDDSDHKISLIINKEVPNFRTCIENTKKVKLYDSYIGAGSASEIEYLSDFDYLYVDNFMIKKAYRNTEIKGLTVIGDSMHPYVNCSDIILFSSLKDRNYLSDGKYVITTLAGTQIKNLSFHANGDIIISSENKAYTDEIIRSVDSQEVIDIVGIVVGRVLKS